MIFVLSFVGSFVIGCAAAILFHDRRWSLLAGVVGGLLWTAAVLVMVTWP